MNLFIAIGDFLDDIIHLIITLIDWIALLAERLNSIDLGSSGLFLILGTYRYLVGDTIYLMHISVFYISTILVAIKTVPIFVSWWKQFVPW